MPLSSRDHWGFLFKREATLFERWNLTFRYYSSVLIHITVATQTPKSIVRRDEILAMHARSRARKHHLTDDPGAAEIIVLAGDLESLSDARSNNFLQQYPEKTMAYSEIDAVVPYVPGVYGSAAEPRPWNLKRTQSNIYFSRYASSMNPEIRHRPDTPKELLFCFRGRRDCRVRANILNFQYHRPDVQVMETAGFMHWSNGIVGQKEAQKDYADALATSHFALCPRGMGFGSIRLFEVMEMGVAPVLLADRYALPSGPDWPSFLIRVPERKFAQLPQLLEHRTRDSAAMGQRARLAWEEFFAPEVIFDRMIDQLAIIRQERIVPEGLFRHVWPLLALPAHARSWASQRVRRVRNQLVH